MATNPTKVGAKVLSPQRKNLPCHDPDPGVRTDEHYRQVFRLTAQSHSVRLPGKYSSGISPDAYRLRLRVQLRLWDLSRTAFPIHPVHYTRTDKPVIRDGGKGGKRFMRYAGIFKSSASALTATPALACYTYGINPSYKQVMFSINCFGFNSAIGAFTDISGTGVSGDVVRAAVWYCSCAKTRRAIIFRRRANGINRP